MARADESALTFTNDADFRFALDVLVAIAGFSESTLDFEGLSQGTSLPSGTDLDGLELIYTIDGLEAQVRAEFDTTSPTRYLALDSLDGAFVSGDSLTLVSKGTIHAFGLFVTGETETFRAGDFELRSDAGSRVLSSGTPSRVLDDGEAFFLGIIDGDGFRQAELESFDAQATGLFVYDVDDVTTAVPEPGGALAFFSTLTALAAFGLRAPSCGVD